MADEYLMLVDGKLAVVDMEPVTRRARVAQVAARADRVGEVAAVLADECFDPRETWDAAEAAGISDDVMDAAGSVAVTLSEIEHRVI